MKKLKILAVIAFVVINSVMLSACDDNSKGSDPMHLYIGIIAGLALLLAALLIMLPLIKTKKREGEISEKEQAQDSETEDAESSGSVPQVVINIKNYHEAKKDLPHVYCKHCGSKNKGESLKCESCGVTL